MFLLGKIRGCCLKCRSPIFYVHRTAKGRQTFESTSNESQVQLQVIGTGAADQPASVVLRAFNKLYLFNCGEGIKRYCQDSRINFKKITNVFFTQSKWQCIGGVINLIFMTFAHSGRLPTFHGPGHLQTIFQRMIHLTSQAPLFQKHFTSDLFTSNQRYEDNRVVIEPIELNAQNDTAIIFYVCKMKRHPGSFAVKKIAGKNIPNELLPALFRGEDVTLADGSVVASVDIRHPDMPEMAFILIDVPNDGFLQDLTSTEKMQRVLDETKATGIEVIVHFTPQNVFNTEQYQHFMRTMDAKRHLIANDRNKYATMKKAFQLQNKLHKIDPKIHPMLSMQLDPHPKVYYLNGDTNNGNTNATLDQNLTFFTKYVFWNQPKDNDDVQRDDNNIGLSIEDATVNAMDRALKVTDEEENSADEPSPLVMRSSKPPLKLKDETFPRVLFLGTSAAGSFPLRNSSGILVHLSKDHSILLDCGTAICAQINRFYGDEAPEIYRRLKAVFVSHMHMDHHIGLPELFRWRSIHLADDREPLRLFCPINDLKSWLLFYANEIASIHTDVKFIDNDLLSKDSLNYHERLYLKIDSMVTCPVKHYRKSYALAMTLPYQNGDKHELFKLAYSGDTGACDAFIKIGQDADLLIHEATYQSELNELAKIHNHSTIGMAMKQARKMHVKYTILTHFSARYYMLPYIGQNELMNNVGIAFDYMEVMPGDLPRLNGLIAKYQEAFPEIAEPLNKQTRKYFRQNQYLKESIAFE